MASVPKGGDLVKARDPYTVDGGDLPLNPSVNKADFGYEVGGLGVDATNRQGSVGGTDSDSKFETLNKKSTKG